MKNKMNQLEQLKQELKEKEKGCGTSITVGIDYSYCGFQNRCFCDKCQAEISSLKKGISACEERDKEWISWIKSLDCYTMGHIFRDDVKSSPSQQLNNWLEKE